GGRLAVQVQPLPENGTASAEAPLPQPLADHGDRRCTGLFFVIGESAPSYRPNSKYSSQRRADQISVNLFRVAAARNGVRIESDCGNFLKRMLLLAPRKKIQH